MKIFTALSAGGGSLIAQLAGMPLPVVLSLLVLGLTVVAASVVPTVLAYRNRRDTTNSIARLASDLPAPERSAVLISLAGTLLPTEAPLAPLRTAPSATALPGGPRIPDDASGQQAA